mmetsp:Transcript_14813/g.41015  ORF Transcript_14813/g.41015 Transcript_14813/m.41015 type:complete len:389 (+) Transcript_14813:158-1324(+)
MLLHARAPQRERPLQRQRGRRRHLRQPVLLDGGRPRPVARSARRRRLLLRNRERQERRDDQRGCLLLPPGLLPDPFGVRRLSPLHHRRVLRRTLRTCHCPSHMEGQQGCRGGHHPAQAHRRLRRQRPHQARGAVQVVPRDGVEQLARHQGRRRGHLQQHEGRRPRMHQAHRQMQRGRRHGRRVCLPDRVHPLQHGTHVAVPDDRIEPVRHPQEVRKATSVLRLLQRPKVAQQGLHPGGAQRQQEARPSLGFVQHGHQPQVPRRLDEGLLRVHRRHARGWHHGLDICRRRRLHLQLPRQQGLDARAQVVRRRRLPQRRRARVGGHRIGAHRQWSHLPAGLRCRSHGAIRQAGRVAGHAQELPQRRLVLNCFCMNITHGRLRQSTQLRIT